MGFVFKTTTNSCAGVQKCRTEVISGALSSEELCVIKCEISAEFEDGEGNVYLVVPFPGKIELCDVDVHSLVECATKSFPQIKRMTPGSKDSPTNSSEGSVVSLVAESCTEISTIFSYQDMISTLLGLDSEYSGNIITNIISRIQCDYTDQFQFLFHTFEVGPRLSPGCVSLDFTASVKHMCMSNALFIPCLAMSSKEYANQDYDEYSEDKPISDFDHYLYTFGTDRLPVENGGGKTSSEMLKNMRLRHASGSFTSIVRPEQGPNDLSNMINNFIPELDLSQTSLRLRRVVGPHPHEDFYINRVSL